MRILSIMILLASCSKYSGKPIPLKDVCENYYEKTSWDSVTKSICDQIAENVEDYYLARTLMRMLFKSADREAQEWRSIKREALEKKCKALNGGG
jgi:hypothetical protein